MGLARGGAKAWLRRLITWTALAYLVSLVLVVILLYAVGEHWWVTAVVLYLPRIVFAAPLPLIGLALWRSGLTRLLWTQIAAAIVLLFPLMGFVLPRPVFAKEDQPKVRVLSYNVNSEWNGPQEIVAEIDRFSPDVVLLQEVSRAADLVRLLAPQYPHTREWGQFLAASRLPIRSASHPDNFPFRGESRTARASQQLIDTPLGPIAFYNVHPLSPRGALYRLRGAGLRREILSGRLLAGQKSTDMDSNDELREAEVRAFSQMANRDIYPVVIAGDMNLPGLSRTFHTYLSAYGDGFREAGWGFGYTFPTDKLGPWMRLDRILASEQLQFIDFHIGRSTVSDHHCVVADLQRKIP